MPPDRAPLRAFTDPADLGTADDQASTVPEEKGEWDVNFGDEGDDEESEREEGDAWVAWVKTIHDTRGYPTRPAFAAGFAAGLAHAQAEQRMTIARLEHAVEYWRGIAEHRDRMFGKVEQT